MFDLGNSTTPFFKATTAAGVALPATGAGYTVGINFNYQQTGYYKKAMKWFSGQCLTDAQIVADYSGVTATPYNTSLTGTPGSVGAAVSFVPRSVGTVYSYSAGSGGYGYGAAVPVAPAVTSLQLYGGSNPSSGALVYASRAVVPVGGNGNLYPPTALTAATTSVSGQSYGNGSYVVSASTTFDANYPPYTAFDKVLQYNFNSWHSNGGTVSTAAPEWIQIAMPTDIRVGGMHIWSMYHTGPTLLRAPIDFTLYGIDDAGVAAAIGSWTNATYTIVTVAQAIATGNFTSVTLGSFTSSVIGYWTVGNLVPSRSYKKFKLEVTKTPDTQYVHIAEWRIFEAVSPTSLTFGTPNALAHTYDLTTYPGFVPTFSGTTGFSLATLDPGNTVLNTLKTATFQ